MHQVENVYGALATQHHFERGCLPHPDKLPPVCAALRDAGQPSGHLQRLLQPPNRIHEPVLGGGVAIEDSAAREVLVAPGAALKPSARRDLVDEALVDLRRPGLRARLLGLGAGAV